MIRSLWLITLLSIMLNPLAQVQAAASLTKTLTAVLTRALTRTLTIEEKIPLGNVKGRIDHLAVDIMRQRLYVAELGNNSVGIVDLKEHRVLRTMMGLSEPQGIAYLPTTDTLYVTNGGDGSVRLFNATNFRPIGQIDLGNDADNVRVDIATQNIYVGYGSGALAVIDPTLHHQVATIPLHAHPESFQLEVQGRRVFINIPDTHEIAVVDRELKTQLASWSLPDLGSNFPMALDDTHQQLIVAFRRPARLAAFSTNHGNLLWSADTCDDADDVFVDARRGRLYVSCGEGRIDIFEQRQDGYRHIESLTTEPGARASLFVPELDRLFVAVRAASTTPAAIWVLRPSP